MTDELKHVAADPRDVAMALHDGELWQRVRECRVVKPEWAGARSRTRVCSVCGMQAFPTRQEMFCSHCGARVVG